MSAERHTHDAPSRASFTTDASTGARVIESIVVRGDLSGLGPDERARFYTQMCEGLGLNPHAQPFAFLKLNGKEVLYATRGATDQLAAIHRLNREIVDGPKVIDLAGTKLVYAVCRATLPNGRFETATATVPLVDPINVLMKAETKAKRRATLSILGLGVLDEAEVEGLPVNLLEPATQTPAEELTAAQSETPVVETPVVESPSLPTSLQGFYTRLAEVDEARQCAQVWVQHRAALAAVEATQRESAWKALCARAEKVGQVKNAKAWLKRLIAEHDARAERVTAAGSEVPS
jgi:hypothetical protein